MVQGQQEEPVALVPALYVMIKLASKVTGFSPGAIRAKIEEDSVSKAGQFVKRAAASSSISVVMSAEFKAAAAGEGLA